MYDITVFAMVSVEKNKTPRKTCVFYTDDNKSVDVNTIYIYIYYVLYYVAGNYACAGGGGCVPRFRPCTQLSDDGERP